jgi:hypothetical protein
MMSQLASNRRHLPVIVILLALLLTQTTQAAEHPVLSLPVLWAKSWMLGFAIMFLCILLGLLAVLLPSMRKVLRKKD